jgi:hypothetical protein
VYRWLSMFQSRVSFRKRPNTSRQAFALPQTEIEEEMALENNKKNFLICMPFPRKY